MKGSENLVLMKEGQKLTNANVHNLREEFGIAKEEIKKLQHQMSALSVTKENSMQAKLDRFALSLQQSTEDIKSVKVLTYKNQDACRDLHQSLSTAQAEIAKIDGCKAEHERRMEELFVRYDTGKENLELTNGVVMRLHAEHEETRMKAIENFTKNREIDVVVQRLGDDQPQMAQDIRHVYEELAKQRAAQDTTRDRLMDTISRVGGLKDGMVNLQNSAHEMGKNVELIHNLASSTQDHLKMTNALVLPNLSSDGAFCPATISGSAGSAFASAHSMNSTATGGSTTRTSTARSKGTPRGRKEAAWFSRNIGSVPDRMAWI
jgi:hypothetical protein